MLCIIEAIERISIIAFVLPEDIKPTYNLPYFPL